MLKQPNILLLMADQVNPGLPARPTARYDWPGSNSKASRVETTQPRHRRHDHQVDCRQRGRWGHFVFQSLCATGATERIARGWPGTSAGRLPMRQTKPNASAGWNRVGNARRLTTAVPFPVTRAVEKRNREKPLNRSHWASGCQGQNGGNRKYRTPYICTTEGITHL